MEKEIEKILKESADIKLEIAKKEISTIKKIAEEIISCYKRGNKVVIFGNGGSAADAQHIATELVCRFEKERKGLLAVALTTNTSALTAIGNDYSFEKIFSRQVESIVNKSDVVIGISTSGNSKNVISAIEQAKKQGAKTVGFAGKNGGEIKKRVDVCLCIPSDNTARIQEGHITVGHIICKLVEDSVC